MISDLPLNTMVPLGYRGTPHISKNHDLNFRTLRYLPLAAVPLRLGMPTLPFSHAPVRAAVASMLRSPYGAGFDGDRRDGDGDGGNGDGRDGNVRDGEGDGGN